MSDIVLEPQQKAAMKPMLEAKLNELLIQRKKYEQKVASLRYAFCNKQYGLEKLKGRSLGYYFYQVIGKLDEKLNQKQQEAYAAKVKLDAAELELAGIETDVQDIQSQLSQIHLVGVLYKELLTKKRAELIASGTLAADQILKMEERIAVLDAQKYEIREAISAGRNASGIADRILSELKNAEGWNTWDMIGGGGFITHAAKHDRLDKAQDLVSQLQGSLRRFKTELADIRITANMQVSIDGFLRFADYFFDGLFADWTVGNKISQSISSVKNTKKDICRTLEKLKELDQAADHEIERLRQKLDDLIVNA